MFAEIFFGWIKRGKQIDATKKRVMLACLACQTPRRDEIAHYEKCVMVAWLHNQSALRRSA